MIDLICGRLGAGKGKYSVVEIRRALLAGRRVATNLDLYLDKLVPERPRAAFVRIPDKPTVRDLESVGEGFSGNRYDENAYGLLVLDELGTWLNSRDFQDKGRQAVIDWLIHARKKGWRVLFIAQHSVMIDKQVRLSLVEHEVQMYRLDRIRIPLIGHLLSVFNDKWGRLPKMHLAVTRMNIGQSTPFIVERDFFTGRDVEAGYDTLQVFKADPDAVCSTWLSPFYFAAPARKPSLLARLSGLFKRSPRAPRPAPRAWPESVRRLSPELRWHVAHTLANASAPYKQAPRRDPAPSFAAC